MGVFDGGIDKDCGYAPVKVAGTVTCSVWIAKDQEQRCISDPVSTELAKSLWVTLVVRNMYTRWASCRLLLEVRRPSRRMPCCTIYMWFDS